MSNPLKKELAAHGLEEFLTTAQVMEIFGVSAPSLTRKVRQGRLHPIKNPSLQSNPGRKMLLYHPHEVEEELRRIQSERIEHPGRGIRNFIKPISAPAAMSAANAAESRKPKESLGNERQTTDAAVAFLKKQKEGSGSDDFATKGQECAEAVRLFSEGKTPLEAIQIMQIGFESIKSYWKSYLELKALSRLAPPPDEAVPEKKTPKPEAPTLTPEEEAALIAMAADDAEE